MLAQGYVGRLGCRRPACLARGLPAASLGTGRRLGGSVVAGGFVLFPHGISILPPEERQARIYHDLPTVQDPFQRIGADKSMLDEIIWRERRKTVHTGKSGHSCPTAKPAVWARPCIERSSYRTAARANCARSAVAPFTPARCVWPDRRSRTSSSYPPGPATGPTPPRGTCRQRSRRSQAVACLPHGLSFGPPRGRV